MKRLNKFVGVELIKSNKYSFISVNNVKSLLIILQL